MVGKAGSDGLTVENVTFVWSAALAWPAATYSGKRAPPFPIANGAG